MKDNSPIIVDDTTEIKIVLTEDIISIDMNAVKRNNEHKNNKIFIFREDNPEDFEIIIRKKEDD